MYLGNTVIPGKRFLVRATKVVECVIEDLDMSAAAYAATMMCERDKLKLLSIEPVEQAA